MLLEMTLTARFLLPPEKDPRDPKPPERKEEGKKRRKPRKKKTMKSADLIREKAVRVLFRRMLPEKPVDSSKVVWYHFNLPGGGQE